MKKLIMSAVMGALFTLTHTNVQATANPPYIAGVSLGSEIGSGFGDYDYYEITVYLDYPQPYVDDLYWYAYHSGATDSGTASWPNPNINGDPLRAESWDGSQHRLDLTALKLGVDEVWENDEVDNSYYFEYSGTESYSYVCHGCYQAYGGIYIFNP